MESTKTSISYIPKASLPDFHNIRQTLLQTQLSPHSLQKKLPFMPKHKEQFLILIL